MATRRGKRANGEGSIYQRPDGKWVTQVPIGRYPNGHTRYKRYALPTQKAARDRLREAQNELARGRHLDVKVLTLAAYLEYWLADVIRPSDLQPKSKQGHAYYAGLVRAKIGHIRLDQLTSEDIERCLNELRQLGGRHGVGHAASSLAHIRNTLRKALGHAVKNGRLPRNVAVDAAPPKVRREEIRPFSEDEAGRLLDAVAEHRLAALYAVALTLGLRRGELLGLLWEDIDLADATLRVRRQLEHIPGEPPRLKTLLKTQSGRRDLRLPEELLGRLRAHREGQRLERERASDTWQERGLVFATGVGTPIAPRNLDRHYKATLRRAGLPDRRLHDLRHIFATLMFRRGLDVTMVSRMLGHASVQITIDIYIHWLPKDSNEAATIGDAFLRGRGERPAPQ